MPVLLLGQADSVGKVRIGSFSLFPPSCADQAVCDVQEWSTPELNSPLTTWFRLNSPLLLAVRQDSYTGESFLLVADSGNHCFKSLSLPMGEEPLPSHSTLELRG
jgi:hypothetical protein